MDKAGQKDIGPKIGQIVQTGSLDTTYVRYAEIILSRLGWDARGEMCDILCGSQLPQQTLWARKCMHYHMIVYILVILSMLSHI